MPIPNLQGQTCITSPMVLSARSRSVLRCPPVFRRRAPAPFRPPEHSASTDSLPLRSCRRHCVCSGPWDILRPSRLLSLAPGRGLHLSRRELCCRPSSSVRSMEGTSRLVGVTLIHPSPGRCRSRIRRRPKASSTKRAVHITKEHRPGGITTADPIGRASDVMPC